MKTRLKPPRPDRPRNLDTAKHPLEVRVNGETVGWCSNAKLAEDQARCLRNQRGAFAVDVIDHKQASC